jgi:hypothetical protein
MTIAVACPNCHHYFNTSPLSRERIKFQVTENPILAIGSKGVFDGVKYEVLGFVVKKELKYKYRWREYLLFNPYEGFAFLSEYNGHWNFIWPIETDPTANSHTAAVVENGKEFDLYQKYEAEVIYAKGEFLFDVFEITATTYNREYIAPPFMYGQEKSDDSVLWYKGEYISRKELAKAFNIPLNTLPSSSGIGYTQPMFESFDERNFLTVTILFALALLALQIIFDTSSQNKVVFRSDFTSENFQDQKVVVSPSFTLEGASKNLDFEVNAPLSNDWLAVDFALINEDNLTEYNFTKEVEYYHGYEDGESWSEGSRVGEAFLSRVPGGKYHLNIYPSWGNSTHSFTITIMRDVGTWSNFWWSLLFISLFPLAYYIYKHSFEVRRWKESEFSPYETE